jgi:hypothetical protein
MKESLNPYTYQQSKPVHGWRFGTSRRVTACLL